MDNLVTGQHFGDWKLG